MDHSVVVAASALALVLPFWAASPPIQYPSQPAKHEPSSLLHEGELPLHCPSTTQAALAIGHYLGRPLAADDPPTALQIVEIRGGYRLELRTAAARHVLEGVDCGHLVELAANVAAVAIDPLAGLLPHTPSDLTQRPDAQGEPSEDAGEPVPEPELDPGPSPSPPEPPPLALDPRPPLGSPPRIADLDVDPPRAPAGLRGLVSASGSLGLGLFPAPSPGFEVGLGLARRPPARRVGLHAELVGGADFAGRFRAEGSATGGDLLAGHGALRACAAPSWRRIELRACGRAGAGVLQARGVGVVSAELVRQPWIFVGAELGLAITLHRNAALVFDVGAAANLLRPHVWTSAPAADYVMPALSGRSRLGLEVRFP